MSHLVFQVPSAHTLLVFPWASLFSCLACSEKGWRDRSRFRPGALVVTVSCSVCWSSASTRRDKARHCLFLRMSGGIIPLTTGSMKVGVDRMHPDTSRRPLFRAASSRCVWALRHLGWAKVSAAVDVWSISKCAPYFVLANLRSRLHRAWLIDRVTWTTCHKLSWVVWSQSLARRSRFPGHFVMGQS